MTTINKSAVPHFDLFSVERNPKWTSSVPCLEGVKRDSSIRTASMVFMFDKAALAALVFLTAFENVPELNVERSCRAVASFSGSYDQMSRCMQNERNARAELAREWSRFAAEDKTHCVDLANIGARSYADLLTCLELARDARAHGKHVAD